MHGSKKQPEKLKGILKAKTLRLGSYRLVTDPSQTVIIRPAERSLGDQSVDLARRAGNGFPRISRREI